MRVQEKIRPEERGHQSHQGQTVFIRYHERARRNTQKEAGRSRAEDRRTPEGGDRMDGEVKGPGSDQGIEREYGRSPADACHDIRHPGARSRKEEMRRARQCLPEQAKV